MAPIGTSDEFLLAYLDGQLEKSHAANVSRLSAENAEISRRLMRLKRTQAQLLETFGNFAREEAILPSFPLDDGEAKKAPQAKAAQHAERPWAGQDTPRLYCSESDRDGDFDGAVPDPRVVAEAWAAWRAEVDFAEAWVDLASERTKCYLFAFRLAYSGKAVHRITGSCGQEAFLDGHVHAFRTLGGIPAGQIRYDNLSPAVTRVIRKSRSREEHPRWHDFRQPLHRKATQIGNALRNR